MSYLIVFFGAGVGGTFRHGVNLLSARLFGFEFPFGTLAVNIVGSLLMGAFIGYFALKGEAGQHWRLFLTTGILGGFTTFSAFSMDVVALVERGETALAAIYASASLGLSIGALFIGLQLIRSLV